MLGFKIDKDIRISKEPALYISNHRGLLDFFVVLRYVNAFVVSKAEVQNIPIFAPAASRTGVIFVKRENKESRGATRKAIVDTILKGGNVLVFPEGTTNALQTTMEFKRGTFEEAAKNGFPVVPISIEYKSERDLWKEGSTWKMFVSQFGKWRTHCKLRFGEPLYSDDPIVLLNSTKQWIDDQMLDIQEGWSEVEFEEVS